MVRNPSDPQAAEPQPNQAVPAPRFVPDLGDEFLLNSVGAKVIKGNQRESEAWLHAPAHLELLKTATERLAEVSAQRGAPVSRVRNVRIALHRATKRIYIFPAHEEDPDRIPIKSAKSSGWINLISVLGAAGITIPVGYRDRFRVEVTSEETPVGPALVIDLAKPLERRTERVIRRSMSRVPGQVINKVDGSSLDGNGSGT